MKFKVIMLFVLALSLTISAVSASGQTVEIVKPQRDPGDGW